LKPLKLFFVCKKNHTIISSCFEIKIFIFLNWDELLYLRDLLSVDQSDVKIPKWVCILKSFEKRLCKTRKYKTVVSDAIFYYFSILYNSLVKKYFYNILFINWCFQIQSFKWLKLILTESWNIPSWIFSPFQSSYFFFLRSRLPKYVIRSTLNLIAHEMTIDLSL
jgi:hypothetical protein